jgi:hypothetical protein
LARRASCCRLKCAAAGSWSWPLHLACAATGLRATQLELAAAFCASGGRAAGFAAGVGRCLLRGLKCSYASSSQAELEMSSCCRLVVLLLGGGLAARPSATPVGGCSHAPAAQCRDSSQVGWSAATRAHRGRSWRCPAPVSSACCCRGGRASCSFQRVSGRRLQMCSRRAGSRLWPGGLKCSDAGSSQAGLEVTSCCVVNTIRMEQMSILVMVGLPPRMSHAVGQTSGMRQMIQRR